MENNNQTDNDRLDQNDKPVRPVPVEEDYEAHSNNPKPAPTVNEPDNKGAGQAMKWIIPAIIIILVIVYFLYFRNNVTT